MSFRPNLKHLEAVLVTARCGSVLAASEQLNLSQPAVSQGLASVEKLLGEKLFHRRSTGVYLTEAGKALVARLEPALGAFSTGLSDVGYVAAGVRRVTMSQLRALVAVADHGSFAKAARAETQAQPTLHRACRTLEANLAIPLFEKTSWGVRPTRQAEELSRLTRLFFNELDQAAIAAASGVGAGRCVIGAMPLARSGLVPRVVESFLHNHPHYKISLIGAPYHDLVSGLRNGRIDFLVGALRGEECPGDLTEEFLFDDPLSILMRPCHPLAGQRDVSLDDIRRYGWVAAFEGTPLREQFVALFAGDEIPANIVECNALSAGRVLLQESDRLMLLSDAQAAYERNAGLLISKPLPGKPRTRAIGFTTRSGWRPTDTQADMLETLRTVSASENVTRT